MKIKNNVLTILILLISNITLLGNPDDLKLIPYNEENHGPDAKRIFAEHFDGSATEALSAPSTAQIAQLNDKIVGFTTHKGFNLNGQKTRFIYNLAIDTPYQGKGYGRALLNQFAAQARQDKINALELYYDPGTLMFYQKQGFISIGGLSVRKDLTPEPGPNLS